MYFRIKPFICITADFRHQSPEINAVDYNYEDIEKWNGIVSEVFPKLKDNVLVFGYDWLGRQFALDKEANNILMLEIGTGDALRDPVSFEVFHNEEITEKYEDFLAAGFFEDWKAINNYVPKHNECIGYKVPLFLGGEDDTDNLEICDMEVYWGVVRQLLH